MACSGEELTKHVETCLSRNSSDVSSNHDVSGSDGEYETYTWCGQTRVRATSFLGMWRYGCHSCVLANLCI